MNQLLKRKSTELAVKKKKGFTLIELIIVIAIIAILAAVAIPKFGAAKHNADVAADQANAKLIATAVSTAVANNDMADADLNPVPAANFQKYIDGGAVPAGKTGTFVVKYTKAGGVVVTVGGAQMYPVS